MAATEWRGWGRSLGLLGSGICVEPAPFLCQYRRIPSFWLLSVLLWYVLSPGGLRGIAEAPEAYKGSWGTFRGLRKPGARSKIMKSPYFFQGHLKRHS